MPPLKDRARPHFSMFDLDADAQKEAIGNAFDIAKQARQDAYDATIRWGGENVTGAQARELLTLITDEGFAALQAQRPRLATQIMQSVRNQAVEVPDA